MPTYTTIHEFCGPNFRVVVRQYAAGRRFRIVIIARQPVKGLRTTVELECGGARLAGQLLALLKSATAMAEHLESGGQVEIWN